MSGTINAKTKVELYIIAACIPFAVGAIFWAASIDGKATAAVKGVNDLQPVAQQLIREIGELKGEIRQLNHELELRRKRQYER